MIPDGADDWMLTCILIARDGSESTISVPSLSPSPPARIRLRADLSGAAVVDVYAFAGIRDPAAHAVYRYQATVPETTDDRPGSDPPPQGPASSG